MRGKSDRKAERTLHFSLTGLAAFVCGATIGVKLDIVGDLYLLEPVLALLALACVLLRGPGRGFIATVFFGFLAAGAITFCGYVLSDLLAANEPSQYLKGWGRVALLIMDAGSVILLAAHGRQNIWWLALGIGVGGVAFLLLQGVPLTQWKLGYGEYVVLLVLTLVSLAPNSFGGILVAAFGVVCVFADYRSQGGLCLVVAAVMLWHRGGAFQGLRKSRLRMMVVASVGITAIAGSLWFTQQEYAERRQDSNIGRYVGILVALRAIAESPLIGYGSWAADARFGRMFEREMDNMDRERRHSGDVHRSLLPHSQIVQAWIEGGVLGLAFFGLYGYRLIGALRWIAWQRSSDALTPVFMYFVASGFLSLLFSPFLGTHRVSIAIAVAVTAVAVHERRSAVAYAATTTNAHTRMR